MQGRRCPHCRLALIHRETQGVEVDVCGECGGLWLDYGEFDALIAQRFHGHDLEDALEQSASFPEWCRFCNLDQSGWEACMNCGRELGIHCPVDNTAMYIVSFGTIELDRCGECKGIWVDGFERNDLGKQNIVPPQTLNPALAGEVDELFPDAEDFPDEPGGGDWGDGAGWGREHSMPQAASAPPVTQRANVAAVGLGLHGTSETAQRFMENLHQTCGGCGSEQSRYALSLREGAFWCKRCIYKGVAPEVGPHVAAMEIKAARDKAVEEFQLYVECNRCEQTLSRHVIWDFDGVFWCTACASADQEANQRMTLARTVGLGKAEFERERAVMLDAAERSQRGFSTRTTRFETESAAINILIEKLGGWFSSR